ncbi:MAG: GNAT family N-acetyltransferase [Burkholderiales bacterium]
MPAIRRARRADASALAAVAEATFRATFATANTPADMERHCRATYGEAIQAAEIADPCRLTLLCEDAGRLVGYAQLRWGKAPACVVAQAPAEIQRLYVVAAAHGKGIAQQLMAACLAALAQRAADVAWLGVWERNPRAIAFYRKAGFREVGEHVFVLGTDAQRDVVMMRPLVPR